MYSETRKLSLIEKMIKLKDEKLLRQVESLLAGKMIDKRHYEEDAIRQKPSDYLGCISKLEADNLVKQIEADRQEWENRNI